MQAGPRPTPPNYGAPIDLDTARRVMDAAERDAAARQWPMVIAIVNSRGHLVMLHAMDQAQHGSVVLAQRKAETALNFRRPTSAFEEAVAGGGVGLRVLAMENVCPLGGGLPLMAHGEVIGAIGVSGMHASQDIVVAEAGVAALAALAADSAGAR